MPLKTTIASRRSFIFLVRLVIMAGPTHDVMEKQKQNIPFSGTGTEHEVPSASLLFVLLLEEHQTLVLKI